MGISKNNNDWYLTGLAKGDNKVITAVLEDCGKSLAKWVMQNNGSEQDAEDVVMYAIGILYRKAKSGNLILSCAFYTYFFQIGKYKWYKTLNRNITPNIDVTDEEFEVYMEVIADASSFIEKEELVQFIKEKFDLLGASCQKLISLLFFKDVASGEAAEIMNINDANLRQKKRRCLQKLRKHFDTDPRSNDIYDK